MVESALGLLDSCLWSGNVVFDTIFTIDGTDSDCLDSSAELISPAFLFTFVEFALMILTLAGATTLKSWFVEEEEEEVVIASLTEA